jgi:hypothetical protein
MSSRHLPVVQVYLAQWRQTRVAVKMLAMDLEDNGPANSVTETGISFSNPVMRDLMLVSLLKGVVIRGP